MLSSARDIIRSYDELAALSDHECNAFQHSLLRRDRKLAWLPGCTAFVVFWAWLIFFGKGLDWLERRYSWDILDLGPGAYALLVLLGFLGALIVALALGYRIWSRSLRKAIETQLNEKRCVWCGYMLVGLESSAGRVRCPECGDHSPIRM